jgi:hypothetical protein
MLVDHKKKSDEPHPGRGGWKVGYAMENHGDARFDLKRDRDARFDLHLILRLCQRGGIASFYPRVIMANQIYRGLGKE